jgi:hypothetical protein
MGARVLNMTCASGKVQVAQQEQLLTLLYRGCQLPSDYASILES